MDRITKSLVSQFSEETGVKFKEESTLFEHFVAHLITSEHFSDSFQTDDVVIGAGNDLGIDAIAIIANGVLITDVGEVEELLETNGYLDVTFVLIQAKRSASFSTAEIGQFAYGVKDFFSEEPKLPQNSGVRSKILLADKIYENSDKFINGNPRCCLYYCTTGNWVEDTQLVARRDSECDEINSLSIFREVTFSCLGAEQLQTLFRKTKNTISTEIAFTERTTFPEIDGVEQAYLGLLPATEYLKLIENSNGDVNSALFFDNVRDWQGANVVNNEMRATLEHSTEKFQFPLLNNGVTVLCSRISPTGNKFRLDDYQIVNGCQTSHVLFHAKEHLDSSVKVPVRLIATSDEGIKNQIIKSTNRQTPVSENELLALSDFQKKLEAYFPTYEGKRMLYYERRSRQYASEAKVEKVRVINMTTLVRAYASIFQELPHRTTRNYKSLLKNVGTEIFNPADRLELYYTAAYAHYRLEYLYRSQSIERDLKPARYHILLGYRLLNSPKALPQFNSKEMETYCTALCESLWDDEKSSAHFIQAAKIAREVADGNLHGDNIRTESFTDDYREAILSNG